MNPLELRPYQLRALTELREHWRERCILAMPTGSGKTVVASELIRLATLKHKRSLFLVHRRELVFQAVDRLAAFGVQAGVILAGTHTGDFGATVASIQTLQRREKPDADLIVIDECHHATSTSWRALIDQYTDAPWVGLSATPFRLDGQGLGALFGRIIAPVSTADLCADGTLHAPVVYAPSTPDMTGVRSKGGDYISSETAALMSSLTGDIIEHWLRITPNRRTVVFAVDIEHSKSVCQRFLEAGIDAAHIDGKTPKPERDATLARNPMVLCNAMVLGEGWDCPALEVAILARPTKSLALHLQQIGRIMRACDGKAGAVVLDHAGNHMRHGFVTDQIEYSLDSKVKKAGEPREWKTCHVCFCICDIHDACCPQCGSWFAPVKKPITHKDGELVRFEPGERRKALNRALSIAYTSRSQQDVLRALIEIGVERGYKRGWPAWKFQHRFGRWPTKEEIRSARNTPQAARPPP